jgi:hypothetical protein
MQKRGSAKNFLQKASKKCLEDYRKVYLQLESLGFIYPALENTLERALWSKFEMVKRQALQLWGSLEVEEAFSSLKPEFRSHALRKYQKKKGDDNSNS